MAASPPNASSQNASIRRTVIRSLVAVAIGAVVTTICVLWVDRPVAEWVVKQNIPRFEILKWITYPPPVVQAWTPAVLALLVLRRLAGPFSHWERTLLVAAVALIVAVQFKDSLKYCFGRTWPMTWIDDNPALIPGDFYGFHPFHGGMGYASFPSGHTVRVVSVVAVCWMAWPRSRIFGVFATLLIAVGLVGMDYHFVGDVVAGGVVGGVVGAIAARMSGVAMREGGSRLGLRRR